MINKIYVTIALLAAFSGGAAAWADAPTCQNPQVTQYPFYCRGKLSLIVASPTGQFGSSTLAILFGKNSQKAGVAGFNLATGTCAWADRPITAAEPSSGFTTVQSDLQPSLSFQEAVIRCSSDPSCVLQLNAANCGNGILWFDPVDVSIWYPHN